MRRRPRGTSRRIPRRDVAVATDQELPALTGALMKAGGRWEGRGSEHLVKFGQLLRPGRFPDHTEAPPCPVTGYVTSNEIKITLGEFG
jgi:hypothetical protein